MHGEVRDFFLQQLIFPVLCTVLGVFRPQHRIYAQLASNYQVHHIFKKQPKNQKTVLKRQKRQKSTFADKIFQTSPWTNFHHFGSKKKFLIFFMSSCLLLIARTTMPRGSSGGSKRPPSVTVCLRGGIFFFNSPPTR
jgi:hypothetical protein